MSLKKRYRETIQPKLQKDLSLKNVHEVPKVLKVTVNRGLGEAAQNAKSLEASVGELAQITGQKVVVTRAKKSHRCLQNPPGHADRLCRHPAG
jgi:large subunit ribosomal protein L5